MCQRSSLLALPPLPQARQQVEAKKLELGVAEGAEQLWVKQWDPTNVAYYFYNTETGDAVWDQPKEYVEGATCATVESVLKIQCMYRAKMARRRAEAQRLKSLEITGALFVDVVRGEFTKDLDWIGKMDPYVAVWLEPATNGGPSEREPRGPWKEHHQVRTDCAHTMTVHGGGKNPVFHDDHHPHLALELENHVVASEVPSRMVLWVEAWDDELGDGNGEFIGQGRVDLEPCATTELRTPTAVAVFGANGSTQTGVVHLELLFDPEHGEFVPIQPTHHILAAQQQRNKVAAGAIPDLPDPDAKWSPVHKYKGKGDVSHASRKVRSAAHKDHQHDREVDGHDPRRRSRASAAGTDTDDAEEKKAAAKESKRLGTAVSAAAKSNAFGELSYVEADGKVEGEWVEQYDPNEGRPYYWNGVTGEAVWEKPEGFVEGGVSQNMAAALKIQSAFRGNKARQEVASKVKSLKMTEGGGAVWVKQWDPSNHAYYYYNTKTGDAVWEEPEGYVDGVTDETITAVLKIQCMFRARCARLKVDAKCEQLGREKPKRRKRKKKKHKKHKQDKKKQGKDTKEAAEGKAAESKAAESKAAESKAAESKAAEDAGASESKVPASQPVNTYQNRRRRHNPKPPTQPPPDDGKDNEDEDAELFKALAAGRQRQAKPSPKASPKPSPKPSPKATPKASTKASPKASPKASTKASAKPSPKASTTTQQPTKTSASQPAKRHAARSSTTAASGGRRRSSTSKKATMPPRGSRTRPRVPATPEEAATRIQAVQRGKRTRAASRKPASADDRAMQERKRVAQARLERLQGYESELDRLQGRMDAVMGRFVQLCNDEAAATPTVAFEIEAATEAVHDGAASVSQARQAIDGLKHKRVEPALARAAEGTQAAEAAMDAVAKSAVGGLEPRLQRLVGRMRDVRQSRVFLRACAYCAKADGDGEGGAGAGANVGAGAGAIAPSDAVDVKKKVDAAQGTVNRLLQLEAEDSKADDVRAAGVRALRRQHDFFSASRVLDRVADAVSAAEASVRRVSEETERAVMRLTESVQVRTEAETARRARLRLQRRAFVSMCRRRWAHGRRLRRQLGEDAPRVRVGLTRGPAQAQDDAARLRAQRKAEQAAFERSVKQTHRDSAFRTPAEACVGGASVARLVSLLDDLASRMRLQERRTFDINAPDRETGMRLLHSAAYHGHEHLVRALLSRGAVANQVDNTVTRQTALHYACVAGHAEVVAVLLEFNAYPHLQDGAGDTPLHWYVLILGVWARRVLCHGLV